MAGASVWTDPAGGRRGTEVDNQRPRRELDRAHRRRHVTLGCHSAALLRQSSHRGRRRASQQGTRRRVGDGHLRELPTERGGTSRTNYVFVQEAAAEEGVAGGGDLRAQRRPGTAGPGRGRPGDRRNSRAPATGMTTFQVPRLQAEPALDAVVATERWSHDPCHGLRTSRLTHRNRLGCRRLIRGSARRRW